MTVQISKSEIMPERARRSKLAITRSTKSNPRRPGQLARKGDIVAYRTLTPEGERSAYWIKVRVDGYEKGSLMGTRQDESRQRMLFGTPESFEQLTGLRYIGTAELSDEELTRLDIDTLEHYKTDKRNIERVIDRMGDVQRRANEQTLVVYSRIIEEVERGRNF